MYTSKQIIRLLVTLISLLVGLALTSATPADAATDHLFATPISDVHLLGELADEKAEKFQLASGVGGKQQQPAQSFLSNGVNGEVYAIVADGNDIYIGGMFDAVGGISAANVAKWNGSQWSALSTGLDGPVYALVWDDNNKLLYAGGTFSHLCSSANCNSTGALVNHLAKWDGSAWSALGNGVNGDVYALALDTNNNLYIGGNFTSICIAPDCTTIIPASNIARWNRDNQTWLQLIAGGASNGVNATVRALAWDGPTRNLLYVGGDFATAGGVSANRVARWDPKINSWARLNYGLSGAVRAMAWDGTNNYLYVGGDFVGACVNVTCGSSTMFNYIARWDGIAWSALESGVSSPVYALALDSNHDLYTGGDFSNAGKIVVKHIAKWSLILNAGNWSPFGGGLDHRVNALTVSGSNIYVAGWFSLGKDTTATGIAKWTPNTGTDAWSALASDIGGRPSVPTLIPTAAMPTGTLTPVSNTWSPFVLNIFVVPVFAVIAIAILVGVSVFGSRTFASSRLTGFAILGLAFLLGAGAFTIGLSAMSTAMPTITPDLQTRAIGNTPVPEATASVSLVVTPISPLLTATATSLPASSPSPIPVQSSPTTTIVSATSTPGPVTNTPTNTATMVAISSPTRTPTVAPRYLAVQLREPRNGQKVEGESATFEWQDIGLVQTDHYELWLRHASSVAWGKSYRVTGGKFVLSIRDGMDYGEYIWSIFVLDSQGNVVSQMGEERKMIWQPRSAPNPEDSKPPPPIFIK